MNGVVPTKSDGYSVEVAITSSEAVEQCDLASFFRQFYDFVFSSVCYGLMNGTCPVSTLWLVWG